ncbi:hypothetical protein MTO96_037035 [Rhipicephalus appendiculatus]
MSRLLAVRPVHNLQDTERLRTLYDELQTGVRSLEALGVASSTYGVLLLTVLGKSFLDYDSLSTVLTQAEAAVNSRPLTFVSSDAGGAYAFVTCPLPGRPQANQFASSPRNDGSEVDRR